jgi:hypothetical protein
MDKLTKEIHKFCFYGKTEPSTLCAGLHHGVTVFQDGIECTAMSTKYLGNHFDIHGGGMDLKFPP